MKTFSTIWPKGASTYKRNGTTASVRGAQHARRQGDRRVPALHQADRSTDALRRRPNRRQPRHPQDPALEDAATDTVPGDLRAKKGRGSTYCRTQGRSSTYLEKQNAHPQSLVWLSPPAKSSKK